MGSRPMMTKHELVPASLVPCSQGLSSFTVGGGPRPDLALPGWQLTKWSLGMEEGGKELIKSPFAVCLLRCKSWENPMTLEPTLSVSTEKNRNQNRDPSGNTSDKQRQTASGPGLVISRQLLPRGHKRRKGRLCAAAPCSSPIPQPLLVS